MATKLRSFFACTLIPAALGSFAQAPTISYSSPQTYKTGITITPLAPVTSGVGVKGYGSQIVIGTRLGGEPNIGVDAAGNVYLADYSNNVIREIPAGNGTPVIIGSGISEPEGVAVDGAGDVYVADYGNHSIKEIPAGNGTPVIIGAGFNRPFGIAVDAAGDVYVADYGNNTVNEILAGTGKTVTLGSGFNGPICVAVDPAGNVYVADAGNNAIKKIPAGNGMPVTIASGFNNPLAVAVDVLGNLYVADYGNNTVKEIPAGSGTPIVLASGFAPGGIAIDGKGNIYEVDRGNMLTKEIKPVGGYYINKTLPAGLSFDQNTGTISGTPTALSPATNYTITAYNATGKSSAIVNIKVIPAHTFLSGLALSIGTLSPAFSSGSTQYTATVLPGKTSVTLTPASPDAGAVIKINGVAVATGTASAAIPLSVGVNIINIVVTETDGLSQTYTVKIGRGENNAKLASVWATHGTFAPVFTAAVTSYASSVYNAISGISITPKTSDVNATVTINGTLVASGTSSALIPLAPGANTIKMIVTAQDGITTQTYTLVTTRALSSNANLSALGLDDPSVTKTTVSGPDAGDYTASVHYTASNILVILTTAISTSTVTVNGVAVISGSTSNPIPLKVGANTITTIVTAQDGVTTKTYVITVTRAAAGMNTVYEPVSVSNPADHPQMMGEEINVHQGLSPNGDGINDFLLIDGIGNYPDNKLSIINRSGQLIFEAKGYDNSTKVFDGHSSKNGTKQLPGTYFYSLDYAVNGVTKHKTGFIVLKY
jgi:gliding motility-associated-like protein